MTRYTLATGVRVRVVLWFPNSRLSSSFMKINFVVRETFHFKLVLLITINAEKAERKRYTVPRKPYTELHELFFYFCSIIV